MITGPSTPDDTLSAKIASGAQALNLSLSNAQIGVLARYVTLLDKWNSVYNLTAVREKGEMVTKHVLDSLSVVPYINAKRVLDAGTGAGLPGIPLAVAMPDSQFVLLDSNRKKTRFVTQAIVELEIPNAKAVTARLEEYRPGQAFDVVISRAVASLADFYRLASPLCASSGSLLVMKGRAPHDELRELPAQAAARIQELHVPGLSAARCIVMLEPSAA